MAETELKHKNNFIKVKCGSCGNEQTIFSVPSRTVKCAACNEVLGESTGHKIALKAEKVKDY